MGQIGKQFFDETPWKMFLIGKYLLHGIVKKAFILVKQLVDVLF